ncbi:MAG TPA: hypothetical protein DCL48_02215 [Alphaproteobacteria bacterium]|nr:hypothetical protein [Alphaproteobacteria bacterium]
MTLVASGAVDHDDIVRLASEAFAGLTSQGPVTPEAGTYAGGEFRAEDDLEQAHLSIAWPGVALGHDDALISQVYATALGGGMSSRLFQEVREKRGLCYSIYCFGQSYKDCGLFGVYAGTSAGQASELLKVVAGEMAAMEGSVTSDEVERAKAQLRAGMLMALESPSARCEQIIGHLWAYGRLLTQAEILDKLAGIDAGAVRAFAGRAAQTGPMSLAAMGPLKKLDSFEHIAARFT